MKKFTKKEILICLLISGLTCIPLFWPALFQAEPAHDLLFHMQRIAAIAENLKYHQPLQLQHFWVQNQGYAVGAFYPSLFLVPFAWLHNLGLNLDVVWKLLTATINIATVFIAYGSFESIFKKKGLALFGTVLYSFAPYRLTDVYLRAALGESLSMVFLPLAAAGLHGVYEEDSHAWIYMGIAYAGICSSHELSLFFVVLFTALYCLMRFRKTFQKHIFLDLIKATLLAVGLSLYFLVPMMEFSKNPLKMNFEFRQVYEESLYPWQPFALFTPTYGGSAHLGYYGHEMPFYLGWPLLVGLFLFPWLLQKDESKEEWILYILAWVSIWLTSNLFPYKPLEAISWTYYFIVKIQFPWRFEMIAVLLLTLVTVNVVRKLPVLKKKPFMHVFAAFAICLGIAHQVSFTRHANYGAIQTTRDLNSNNYMGGEFLPEPHDDKIFKKTQAGIVSGELPIYDIEQKGFDLRFTIENTDDQFRKVTLPFTYYKQFSVVDETSARKLVKMNDGDGKLCVVVPDHYKGTIHVFYQEPTSFKIARLFSIFLVVALIVFDVKQRRIAKQ